MNSDYQYNQGLLARFKPFLKNFGGIFTKKKRGQLLGLDDLPGRPNTKIDFWYDVRTRVKNSFIDLELFIETSETETVNQVITKENLEGFVYSLLHNPLVKEEANDITRAEIAQLFVEVGLRYLLSVQNEQSLAPKIVERNFEDTIGLSQYVIDSLKLTQKESVLQKRK